MKYITLLLIILVSVLLSGCFAANYAVGTMDTVQGLRAAINGNPGTFIYTHPTINYVLIGWCQGENYAVMFIDHAGNVLKDWSKIVGTKTNWTETADFLNHLQRNGWTSIPAGLAPPAVIAGVKQIAFLLSISQVGLPTLFVIPMDMIINPLDIINPEIQV